MDKELAIAAKYALTPTGYERFTNGGDLHLAEWVWLFEALLHSGCDIADRWAVVKDRIDSRPDRQGLPPIQLNTFAEQLASCEMYDVLTGEHTRSEHINIIDSIKRELAEM